MATKKISLAQLIKTMRFPELYELVQGLEGKKCWKAAFGYGGEFHLHFGARIPCHNPNLAGESKGAWIFGTCGTPWHLVTSAGSIEGATVTKVAISLPDGAVTIYFTNKRRLLVTPGARDRRYDVPYWELFMPHHKFVTFGPGTAWSRRRSDLTPQRQSPKSGRTVEKLVF